MRMSNPVRMKTDRYDPIDGEALTQGAWIFLGDLQTRVRLENQTLVLLDMSGVMRKASDGFYRTADNRQIEVRQGVALRGWVWDSDPVSSVGQHVGSQATMVSSQAPGTLSNDSYETKGFDNPLIARKSLRPASDPLLLRAMRRSL